MSGHKGKANLLDQTERIRLQQIELNWMEAQKQTCEVIERFLFDCSLVVDISFANELLVRLQAGGNCDGVDTELKAPYSCH